METPLVSICSVTYNHAPFIRQCLDGFLMQQCDFPIEIIINDDCSTDGTTEIIREYVEKYPDKIFPIFHEENLYSQGVRGMFQKFVFPKARGKYIALCEGDDYWTDPLKLQKQVDFLEAHPDYSMCFHGCVEVSHADINVDNILQPETREYSRYEILENWIVATASVVFLSSVLAHIPHNENFKVGDNVVFLTCSYHGKIYGMSESMACYRRHANGWTARKETEVSEMLIQHNMALKESFPADLYPIINKNIALHFVILFRNSLSRFNLFKVLRTFYAANVVCAREFYRKINETTNNKVVKKITNLFR